MKRVLMVAAVLISFTGLSLAQLSEESASRASLKTVVQAIQLELESHGERVMGKDTYHWSTRLEKFEDCRADFTVRITNNLGDPTVHVESIHLSLGAIEPYGIEIQQKHWLQLPCLGGDDCIVTLATCKQTNADGIVTDCSTPSQKRMAAFSLQLDGDADSAQRLQAEFRQAALACSQPSSVTF
jgi:hypothetical protein